MKVFLCVTIVFLIGATVLARPKHEIEVDPEQVPGLFEGDILIREGSKNGIINTTTRWPNATLVYELDNNFTLDETARILTGLAEIERVSCIRFRERNGNDTDYVFVQKRESGCYSEVGRIGGRQVLNLQAVNCINRHGTVVHEFLHALGFYHEQSRPDRDDYVTIVWDKIEQGLEDNFNKYNFSEVTTYGAPYDYGSVLHYPAVGFSIDGSPTIVPKLPGVAIGQRLNISSIDAGKLRLMYDCPL